MKYLTIVQKNEYGYSVSVPALPGCHSQGESEREALVNIKDVIRTYLTMDGTSLKGAKVREVEASLSS